MIIAIDGPSGSGKTTVAKEVSRRLGFSTLDTGAMYRAVTYRGLQMGYDLQSMSELSADQDIAETLADVAQQERIEFGYDDSGQPVKVMIGGQDVTVQIRTPEVDGTVSVVSAYPPIREAMVAQQREMAQGRDTVLEGRDIGTVVFPNADLKIFLTASDEERARRRVAQNIERGIGDADEAKTLELIRFRDKFDSSREAAPLAKAEDAVEIDTTSMTFEEVVDRICEMVGDKKQSKVDSEESFR